MKKLDSLGTTTSLLLLTLFGLGSACASTEADLGGANEVSRLVRYDRLEEANALANRRLRANPGDPQAQRNLRDTVVALRLKEGIEQLFLDRVEGALKHFNNALDLDPTNVVAQRWVKKANVQIAEDSLTTAAGIDEKLHPEDKVAALQRVLSHLPKGDMSERVLGLRAKAIRGLISVQMFQAYERGGTYSTYQDGLRDLNRSVVAQGLGEELRSGIADSLEVQITGVERRFLQAGVYESEGLLLAARFGYEVVLSLQPGHLGARKGLQRIVARLQDMDVAELANTQNWKPLAAAPEAETPLISTPEAPLGAAQAESMDSEAREVSPADPVPQTDSAKLEQLYASAKQLESKGKLGDAVDVYDEITRLQPEYEDVPARRETIAEFIIHAESLYTRAMDADDQASAIELLESILVFWPDYRDVKEQLKTRKASAGVDQ